MQFGSSQSGGRLPVKAEELVAFVGPFARTTLRFGSRLPAALSGREFRRSLLIGLAGSLAVGLLQPPGTAAAQEPLRGQTPFERPRPEFDPIGLTAGGFRIVPRLLITESYDDNIRAEDENEEDDFITEITASVAASSNWSNHMLAFGAFGQLNRFAENDEEDTEEGGVQTLGRLDISRSSNLSGLAFFRHEAEDRTDPDNEGDAKPTELDRYVGQLTYEHQFSRVQFLTEAQVQRIDFTTSDDDDRDRTQIRFAPRVGYELIPSFRPFVEGTYSQQAYDTLESGVDRDSESWGAFVGAEFEITSILEAEAFVGYFSTEFDDPDLESVDGIGGGAELTWLVTDLTSVQASLSRGEEQTTQASASTRIRTTARLRVEHEFLRNLLLEGELLYLQDDFQGIDRLDDVYGATVGASYLLNRNVALSLDYNFVGRESDAAGEDFEKNVVLLSTQLQF